MVVELLSSHWLEPPYRQTQEVSRTKPEKSKPTDTTGLRKVANPCGDAE